MRRTQPSYFPSQKYVPDPFPGTNKNPIEPNSDPSTFTAQIVHLLSAEFAQVTWRISSTLSKIFESMNVPICEHFESGFSSFTTKESKQCFEVQQQEIEKEKGKVFERLCSMETRIQKIVEDQEKICERLSEIEFVTFGFAKLMLITKVSIIWVSVLLNFSVSFEFEGQHRSELVNVPS
jgi:hypothetical protein